MKKLSSSLILLTSLIAGTAQAAEAPRSSGHAVTLCKAQAKLAHEDYLRSKATKIKLTRGVYKIKLKVNTESETHKTHCDINKDGTISYVKV